MAVSLILAIIAGIPFVDTVTADGKKISGIPTVIGAGFSGTFSSIGIVLILGALIGSVLEKTGAALKLLVRRDLNLLLNLWDGLFQSLFSVIAVLLF